jgi:hypothetical protein
VVLLPGDGAFSYQQVVMQATAGSQHADYVLLGLTPQLPQHYQQLYQQQYQDQQDQQQHQQHQQVVRHCAAGEQVGMASPVPGMTVLQAAAPAQAPAQQQQQQQQQQQEEGDVLHSKLRSLLASLQEVAELAEEQGDLRIRMHALKAQVSSWWWR